MKRSTLRRPRCARSRSARRRQRGAVLVELTLVAPFLLLMVLGVTELGLRTQSSQTVATATRAAARAASSAGDDRLADFTGLQALAGSLSTYGPGEVERIIFYNASTIDGALPAGCDAVAVTGTCNHYDLSDLALPASAFATDAGSCAGTSPDASWCPVSRNNNLLPGADWIGVEVWVNHDSFAPFLADTVIKERTVMRLEPRFDS